MSTRVFFSPPLAEHAYGWHTDLFDNIHIQIRGRKTWKIANGMPVSLPLWNDGDGAQGNDPRHQRPDEFTTLELEPGDALLVPRGTWHATGGVSEEGTCALSIEMQPLHWGGALSYALDSIFCQEPELRELARIGRHDFETFRERAKRLRELLADTKDERLWGLFLEYCTKISEVPRPRYAFGAEAPAQEYVLDSDAIFREPRLAEGGFYACIVEFRGKKYRYDLDDESLAIWKWIAANGVAGFHEGSLRALVGVELQEMVSLLLRKLLKVEILKQA